jgi:hypothetical protein
MRPDPVDIDVNMGIGGARSSPLPDFYIGAHGADVLTTAAVGGARKTVSMTFSAAVFRRRDQAFLPVPKGLARVLGAWPV